MVRTILMSMATVVLTAALANGAAPPGPVAKEGFRVYSYSPRCRSAQLIGIHTSPRDAFATATENRDRAFVEVTTGSEGVLHTLPTRAALYHVYSMGCVRAGWQRRSVHGDAKKAEEAAKALEKSGDKVQVVHDYAPKEVFHVYARPFKAISGRELRLLGTYVTLPEACAAAQGFRNTGSAWCELVAGTNGPEYLLGTPTRYELYGQCKGAWAVLATKEDGNEARALLTARVEGERTRRFELVAHYEPKKAATAPQASGTFDGKKARFSPTSSEKGVGPILVLLKSCHDQSVGTAAELESALKGTHVRLAFAEPREIEINGKRAKVTEIVLTLPLSTGVFWLRSGNKILRASKYEFKQESAFVAWLGKARSAE